MHKEIRNTLAYIVVASFVVITAIWQAQVSAARDLEARHRSLPPPLKTKHAIRPAPQPFTGDPVADYVERCGKGMTDQEIAWIVEDFKSAGLDRPPGAAPARDYLKHRQTQHRWYRDALVDGLRLTPEQSVQVSAKLAEVYQSAEKTYMDVINALKPITGSDGKQYLIASAETFNSVITANSWIESTDGAFLPRNLCALTPEQEKITRKIQVDPSPQTHQPAAELPFAYHGMNSILPLSGQTDLDLLQKSQGDTEALKKAIRSLHPAQFNLFLLFNPTLAAKIEISLGGEPR